MGTKPLKQQQQEPETQQGELIEQKANLPAYLQRQGPARGMEGVTSDDLIIPRLELVQSLSPARDKTSPDYIEGAEEGMFYNSVTRRLYGTDVRVLHVKRANQWLIWKDRKQGGGGASGFRGAFPLEQEAKARLAELSKEEQGLEVVKTPQHFLIILPGKHGARPDEVVLSMPKSKAKVSKKWNSWIEEMLIRQNLDSFSRVFRLAPVVAQNAKGDKYLNLTFAALDEYPTEPVYRHAESLYSKIASGSVVIDQNFDAETGNEGAVDDKEF